MIANPEKTTLVSSVGWVDHDTLWLFHVPAARAECLSLGSGARYLSLHSSGSDRFSVGHHFDGTRFELKVHSFSNPGRVQAQAILKNDENRLAGDSSAWENVPLLYVEYLSFEPWKDFVLLRVSPQGGLIRVQRLEWFDDTYDKVYQGVIGVLELPGEEVAVVSVQRSSQLIIHDLDTGLKKGAVDLGGYGGNSDLQFRNEGKEIWANNYDSIVVIQRSDWRILGSARLQGTSPQVRGFIGDFSFAPDEEICAVARPFSGDVVGIDTATLKIKRTAKLGRQPLEVVALAQGEVVARDWKTGDLLHGKLDAG